MQPRAAVPNIGTMSRNSAGPEHCPRSWLGTHHDRHARRTLGVVILTLVMMVAEIAGGYWYGSMALVADGWHMGTQVEVNPPAAGAAAELSGTG